MAKRTKSVTVSLPDDLFELFSVYAFMSGTSFSKVVREAIDWEEMKMWVEANEADLAERVALSRSH